MKKTMKRIFCMFLVLLMVVAMLPDTKIEVHAANSEITGVKWSKGSYWTTKNTVVSWDAVYDNYDVPAAKYVVDLKGSVNGSVFVARSIVVEAGENRVADLIDETTIEKISYHIFKGSVSLYCEITAFDLKNNVICNRSNIEVPFNIQFPGKIQNLKWSDKTLSWDALDHAKGYEIEITTNISEREVALVDKFYTTATSVDFSSSPLFAKDATFKIGVRAICEEGYVGASSAKITNILGWHEWAKITEDGILEHDTIPNAERYRISISGSTHISTDYDELEVIDLNSKLNGQAIGNYHITMNGIKKSASGKYMNITATWTDDFYFKGNLPGAISCQQLYDGKLKIDSKLSDIIFVPNAKNFTMVHTSWYELNSQTKIEDPTNSVVVPGGEYLVTLYLQSVNGDFNTSKKFELPEGLTQRSFVKNDNGTYSVVLKVNAQKSDIKKINGSLDTSFTGNTIYADDPLKIITGANLSDYDLTWYEDNKVIDASKNKFRLKHSYFAKIDAYAFPGTKFTGNTVLSINGVEYTPIVISPDATYAIYYTNSFVPVCEHKEVDFNEENSNIKQHWAKCPTCEEVLYENHIWKNDVCEKCRAKNVTAGGKSALNYLHLDIDLYAVGDKIPQLSLVSDEKEDVAIVYSWYKDSIADENEVNVGSTFEENTTYYLKVAAKLASASNYYFDNTASSKIYMIPTYEGFTNKQVVNYNGPSEVVVESATGITQTYKVTPFQPGNLNITIPELKLNQGIVNAIKSMEAEIQGAKQNLVILVQKNGETYGTASYLGGSWYISLMDESSLVEDDNIYDVVIYVSGSGYRIKDDAVNVANKEAATSVVSKGNNANGLGMVEANYYFHTHKGTLVDEKKATCTEAGNVKYYICSCGDYFEDAECTKVIEDKNSVLIKAGHNLVTISGTAPTCTEAGESDTLKCDKCNTVFVDAVVIPATGHTYMYTYDKEQHWQICAICGTAFGNKENHEFGSGDVCNVCSYDRGNAHVHEGGTATCTKKAICEICGDEYGDIDPGKHDFFNQPYHATDDKLQHYQACKECGVKSIPVAHGETEIKNKKDATCTEKGYTGDKCCKDCGVVIEAGTDIAATGHSFDAGRVTKEPTKDAEGEKTYTCTKCGDTKTEVIDKLPDDVAPTPGPSPEPVGNPEISVKGKFDVAATVATISDKKPVAYAITTGNKKAGKISKTGIFTAKKSGEVEITAYADKKKTDEITKVKLVIKDTKVPAKDTISFMDDTCDLKSKITNLPLGVDVKFSISEKQQKVATVDAKTGIVTPVKDGKAKVTVEIGEGKNAAKFYTTITVKTPKFSSSKPVVIKAGNSKPLSLKNVKSDVKITWSVSDGTKAEIVPGTKDSKIKVKGIAAGKVTLTADVNGHKIAKEIEITE